MKKENKKSLVKFINMFPKMVDVFPAPEPAEKMLPDWYKKTDSYYNNDQTPYNGNQRLTVKKCMAVFDVMTAGYFFKAPCDIYIDTTDGKTSIEVPDLPKIIGITPMTATHDMLQLEKFPIDTNSFLEHIFRINLVWVMSTEPGYSTMFIQPQHNDDSPLFAVSAVIDTDNYASEGLFSFLVKKDVKAFIKKGDPIIQAIPFKRQDFYSETLSSKEESDKVKEKRGFLRTVFNSGYKKHFWKKKNYK